MPVPRSDESMIRGGDRPVELNPFLEIQRDLETGREIVEREIRELREILHRSRVRRQCDD